MRLIPIPQEKYDEYRLTLMFDCYKWDPQFLDHNTVAKYALVLTEEEHAELARLTEKLDEETIAAENFLNVHPEYIKPLALPKSVKKEILKMQNYEPDKHVRLMRYDFHPIVEGGWAVSEVNSDVPGGFAESSFMPRAALQLLEAQEGEKISAGEIRNVQYGFCDFAKVMVEAIAKKVKKGGRIMMVHCTCYSDDRQVMQFLGDRLEEAGFQVLYGAADHLHFMDHQAVSILDGNEGPVDGIFRFTPLEWLTEIKPKRWQGYFDTTTTSCNHPVAMYAQTKRFPLVWKDLEQNGISVDTWRELLPDTLEVKDAKGKEGYIYKPACGRVGEKISIEEACVDNEYQEILKEVKRYPKRFLAQKKFHSQPLKGPDGGEYHVCLGSYCVDGKHAGFYARISETPRIDSNAADIPVLICRERSMESAVGEMTKSVDMAKAKGEEATHQEELQQENAVSISYDSNLPTTDLYRADKEMYKVWAPAGKKWVDWVRPVPFAEMEHFEKGYGSYGRADITDYQATYLEEAAKDTAIIVDLYGAESVREGMALARKGYRPIPIFNGTVEQKNSRATSDNESASYALMDYAAELAGTELPEDAPPTFLTDRNRLHRYKVEPGVFDNSWDVYHQDLPSSKYFLANNVRKIIVVGESVARDMVKILYPFQKKGIEIFLTNGYDDPKKVVLRKPSLKEKV